MFDSVLTWSTSLGLSCCTFGDLTDVEITEFIDVATGCAGDEDVRAFEIAVEDFEIVESFETDGHLCECSPYLGFIDTAFQLALVEEFGEVTLCELHDDAEDAILGVEEAVTELDDVRRGDGGQNTDFVESVLSLLRGHQ